MDIFETHLYVQLFINFYIEINNIVTTKKYSSTLSQGWSVPSNLDTSGKVFVVSNIFLMDDLMDE